MNTNDSGISTAWGFKATRNADGSLTVHDVPVFVTCTRGKVEFAEAWLDKALARAKQAESDGYLPPLHVRHHEGDDSQVRSAGVFRITRKQMVRFKGGLRAALLADLIVTDPAAQADVLAKRLPYRSVEIFDVDNPNLDSLALLDHEAPFLELPMLVVREVVPGSGVQAVGAPVGGAVSRETFSMERSNGEDGVVLSFSRQRFVSLMMEANAMPEDAPKDKKDDAPKKDGPPKGDKQGKDGGEGGLDVGAVLAAIKNGSISVKDFAAIKDAMAAQESGGEEKTEPKPNADALPAPAAGPATAMRRSDGIDPVEFARVSADAAAAKAELSQMKAERECNADVDAAVESLKDRALGSDVRGGLLKFRKAHGAVAFKAYVEQMQAVAPRIGATSDGRKAEDFGAQGANVPAVAMKYQKDGVDAVERAAKFAREHATLIAGGHTRISVDRYVEINMAGGAKAIVGGSAQ